MAPGRGLAAGFVAVAGPRERGGAKGFTPVPGTLRERVRCGPFNRQSKLAAKRAIFGLEAGFVAAG